MTSDLHTRRGALTLLTSVGLGLAAAPVLAQPQRLSGLAALERARGGRLGVFALDMGSGRTLGHRADERFLMCSTFKALEAAAILARVDAGRERLDRRVRLTPADMIPNSGVSQRLLPRGYGTVAELCAAMVSQSDNSAANLLLPSLGGPEGLTAWLRRIGDGVTRIDRNEPDLNRHMGELDTTTPRAMAGTLRTLLYGRALTPASRARLNRWLLETTTGPRRLRAGLPSGWRLAHKTGTSDAYTNDIGVTYPAGRAPIFISVYYEAPRLSSRAREGVAADAARLIAAWAE